MQRVGAPRLTLRGHHAVRNLVKVLRAAAPTCRGRRATFDAGPVDVANLTMLVAGDAHLRQDPASIRPEARLVGPACLGRTFTISYVRRRHGDLPAARDCATVPPSRRSDRASGYRSRLPRATASTETATVAPMWSVTVPGVRVGIVAGGRVMVDILSGMSTISRRRAVD